MNAMMTRTTSHTMRGSNQRNHTVISTIALIPLILLSVSAVDHSYDAQISEHLELFHHHPDVEVIGPNRFPKPTELLPDVVPYLKPYHGAHRPDQDAVVAYAAEYPLSNYIAFIESLRDSGFTGDVVLALSPLDVRILPTLQRVCIVEPIVSIGRFLHDR